jgi:multidrug resistance efflux pump
LRAAQANLETVKGQLTQARNHCERRDTLVKQGWTASADHDHANQAQQTVHPGEDLGLLKACQTTPSSTRAAIPWLRTMQNSL